MQIIRLASIRRLALLVVFMMFTALMAGCWDLREIDQRAIIMSLGVDKAEEGPGYSVTFEIPVPVQFDVQAGGSSNESEANRNIKAEGRTLKAAIHNVALRTSRMSFFGHLQITVISEEVAKEGIAPIIDALVRRQEVQRPTRIAIARGKASDVMDAKPATDKTFGTYMTTFFEKGNRTRRVPDSHLWRIDSGLARPYESFVIPLLKAGEEQIAVTGVAVMKDGRMVGELNPNETLGYLWLQGEIIEEVITINLELAFRTLPQSIC